MSDFGVIQHEWVMVLHSAGDTRKIPPLVSKSFALANYSKLVRLQYAYEINQEDLSEEARIKTAKKL